MRTTDDNDLREFRRKYATQTDWAHRRPFGIAITIACVIAAFCWWLIFVGVTRTIAWLLGLL